MASITHFKGLSAEDGFYIGPKGQERLVVGLGLSEPGNQFFVDSGSGSDSNNGKGWASALATLDAAFAKCTANNGDIIWVAPGHAETFTTTGNKITADIAGVRIIGTGFGADRPTFTFSHTGATMAITANSVIFDNLLFVTGIDSVTTIATISGNDCTMGHPNGYGVEVRDTTNVEVIDAFTVTGDRFKANVYHHGYTSGNANLRTFKMNGVDDAQINVTAFGKAQTAVVNFVSNACTNITVTGIFLVTGTTDLSKDVVDTVGGSTWSVEGFDVGAGFEFSGGSGAAVTGSDVSALGTKVDSVGTQTASVGTQAGSVGTQTGSVGTLVSTANSKADSVGTQTGSVGTLVSTANSKVDSTGTQTNSVGILVSTANSKVDSVGTRTGSVGTQADSVGTLVSTANSKVDSVGTQTGSVGTQAGSVGTQTGSVGTLVSTANSKLDSVGTQTGSVGTQTGSVGTQTNSVGTLVSTANSKADSIGTQTGSVGTLVSTANSKVDSVGTQTGSVGTQTGSVGTLVSTANSKADSVGTQTGSVGTQVGSVGTQTGSVGTLVSTANSKVDSVGTQTGSVGTQTGSVGTQVSTADSRLTSGLLSLGGTQVSKTVTYTGAVSYTAFTVTGAVAVKVVGYITTALTNHADTTSVGTSTSAAGLIAATAGTAMQTVNQIWVDNAPSKFESFPSGYSVIGDGEDISVVGTANLTGGVVELYCFYIPLSSGASVVAA
ncbi:MAG: hypothetical protein ACFFDF_00395 [Candidatus Odinarchaeota archaeon]